jgi:hypothetical protein
MFTNTFKVKKIKKTPELNSSHQMKSFDTKIDDFGGLNQCQRYFSLSTVGIYRPLSPLLNKGLYIFYAKIELKKNQGNKYV